MVDCSQHLYYIILWGHVLLSCFFRNFKYFFIRHVNLLIFVFDRVQILFVKHSDYGHFFTLWFAWLSPLVKQSYFYKKSFKFSCHLCRSKHVVKHINPIIREGGREGEGKWSLHTIWSRTLHEADNLIRTKNAGKQRTGRLFYCIWL